MKTIGTGTFARVFLCKQKRRSTHQDEDEANNNSGDFFALKVLSMHDVIRLKQVDHVKSEKNILLEINHPFLVDMIWHYKDKSFLYMLFPYVCGGELFSYLRSVGRFGVATAQFYAVEIVSALDYLHSLSIVYRDLKPENLLLDKEGHLRITDFGFAKRLGPESDHRTWTLCGTPEYLAPEIIQSRGHGFAVDWWALGILTYEMLAGFPPFYDDNPFGIYQKILAGKIDWPRHFEPNTKDFIKRLLTADKTKRLGAVGAREVKRHRWFKSVEWENVSLRRLKPPIVPTVSHDGDVSNYEDYEEIDWKNTPQVAERDRLLFQDF